MNEGEKQITEAWQGIGITDLYARPDIGDGLLTNIGEAVMGEDQKQALKWSNCDEKNNKMPTSDYELFAARMRNRRDLVCTLGEEIFCDQISLFDIKAKMGIKEEPEDFIRRIWMEANTDILNQYNRFTDLYRANNVQFVALSKNAFYSPDPSKNYCFSSQYYDLSSEIIELEKKCKSGMNINKFSEYVENLIVQNSDEKNNTEAVHLFVDLRGYDYQRPDIYHVSLALEGLKNGKKAEPGTRSLLIFGMLFCMLQALREKKVILHLSGIEDGSVAASLISYLEARSLCPEIRLAFEEFSSAGAILSLCRKEGKKRIYPEMVFSAYDSAGEIRGRWEHLLGVYPLSKIKVGGALTTSPTFFAYHACFRRLLAGCLLNLLHEENAAQRAGEKILENIE